MTPHRNADSTTASNRPTWAVRLVIWFVVFAPVGSAALHLLGRRLP